MKTNNILLVCIAILAGLLLVDHFKAPVTPPVTPPVVPPVIPNQGIINDILSMVNSI